MHTWAECIMLMFVCILHKNIYMCMHTSLINNGIYIMWISVHSSRYINANRLIYSAECVCVHVCLPCVSSALCLSVDLSSACWDLFQFGHSLHSTAIAPETCQKRRFPFIRSMWISHTSRQAHICSKCSP